MNIRIVLQDMPCNIKAFTAKNQDDSYTIFINSRHCIDTQKAAYIEELKHIDGNDFDIDLQADLIEAMRHKNAS